MDTYHLKNRVDVPLSYHEVTLDAVLNLPKLLTGSPTSRKSPNWPTVSGQITPFEGVPLSVVGFLVNNHPNESVKVETGEKTNCSWTGATGKPLRAVFGHRRASAVTTADVTRYINSRKSADLANATVNREIELLHRALRLGVESRRIVRMPVFPAKLPERNARQGFFETGDFRKILPFLSDPLDDMARFAFETGWRRGMLIGMRWEHVDLAGRSVTLPDSKNDDPQTMPLDGELWKVIERRWKAREYATTDGGVGISAFVFHRGGSPIPTSTFDTQFAAARKKAGVVGAIFHDLRRTAARNMIRGGVPQSVAMRVTGHRSTSMFQRYDIASIDDKLEALHRARAYAESRAAVGENVSQFSGRTDTPTDTRPEIPAFLLGNLVAVQGLEPQKAAPTLLTNSKGSEKKSR